MCPGRTYPLQCLLEGVVGYELGQGQAPDGIVPGNLESVGEPPVAAPGDAIGNT